MGTTLFGHPRTSPRNAISRIIIMSRLSTSLVWVVCLMLCLPAITTEGVPFTEMADEWYSDEVADEIVPEAVLKAASNEAHLTAQEKALGKAEHQLKKVKKVQKSKKMNAKVTKALKAVTRVKKKFNTGATKALTGALKVLHRMRN